MAFLGVMIGAIVEFDVNVLFTPMRLPELDHALLDILLPGGTYRYIFLILMAALAAFCITGAGNALNDFYDRELDRKAHPERPIPSGKVSAKGAWGYARALFIIGIVCSLFINWLCFLFAVFNSLCLLYYESSLKAKGFIGNITISYLTASVFLFGGASVFSIRMVVVLFLLAFLANIGREVTKDIQDMEADRRFRRTLPMTKGTGYAASMAVSMAALAVALSSLPILIGVHIPGFLAFLDIKIFCYCKYGPIVTVADVIFIYSCYLVFNDPKKAQLAMKVAMSIALVAFLIGGLFQP
jgi:geranylgeranylglycerol-phosphate geranylgeranyltransferase